MTAVGTGQAGHLATGVISQCGVDVQPAPVCFVNAGFTLLSLGDTPYGNEVSEGAERLYIVARADK